MRIVNSSLESGKYSKHYFTQTTSVYMQTTVISALQQVRSILLHCVHNVVILEDSNGQSCLLHFNWWEDTIYHCYKSYNNYYITGDNRTVRVYKHKPLWFMSLTLTSQTLHTITQISLTNTGLSQCFTQKYRSFVTID